MGSEKLKKGWKYGAGAEGGGGGEITLPFAKLCYTFEEKNFFSVTIIFEGWLVGLGQEGLRDGR